MSFFSNSKKRNLSFYREIYTRARLCHSKSSVHPFICPSLTFGYSCDRTGWKLGIHRK